MVRAHPPTSADIFELYSIKTIHTTPIKFLSGLVQNDSGLSRPFFFFYLITPTHHENFIVITTEK